MRRVPLVHVIQLHGAIMPGSGGPASGPVLNIDALEEGIAAAFKPASEQKGAFKPLPCPSIARVAHPFKAV